MDEDWYGIRTVYEHVSRKQGQDRLYEERIVLIRAGSFEEALAKAEAEANSYATEGVRFLNYSTAFRLFDPPTDGAEVFSLMRDSRRDPKRYIDTFIDTGRERSHQQPTTPNQVPSIP